MLVAGDGAWHHRPFGIKKDLGAGRLVEVTDSYTLIPLDQPTRLAGVIREFTGAPR